MAGVQDPLLVAVLAYEWQSTGSYAGPCSIIMIVLVLTCNSNTGPYASRGSSVPTAVAQDFKGTVQQKLRWVTSGINL